MYWIHAHITSQNNQKSDSFAIVKVGNVEFKTKVRKKTNTPEWKQEFVFLVEQSQKSCEINLWNWTLVGAVRYWSFFFFFPEINQTTKKNPEANFSWQIFCRDWKLAKWYEIRMVQIVGWRKRNRRNQLGIQLFATGSFSWTRLWALDEKKKKFSNVLNR